MKPGNEFFTPDLPFDGTPAETATEPAVTADGGANLSGWRACLWADLEIENTVITHTLTAVGVKTIGEVADALRRERAPWNLSEYLADYLRGEIDDAAADDHTHSRLLADTFDQPTTDPAADSAPAAVEDLRAMPLARITGFPAAVAQKLAADPETTTVGELIDWVNEDWGGMAEERSLIKLLRERMRVSQRDAKASAESLYAFLANSGHDPRRRLPLPEPADDADPGLVAEAYADGGVVLVNPSPHGGTWAWCHVSAGERVREASGTVTPEDVSLLTVSNNVTEFLALLRCLEALPDGWSGRVHSDSGITLQRFERPVDTRMNGIPEAWVGRLRAVRRRLGEMSFVLLGGHPSKKELVAGQRKDGKPVSAHNVWADKECQRVAKELTPTTVEAQPVTRTEHLLTILAEECSEVAQRVSKALRFGLEEVQPGQSLTNAQRIMAEVNDLCAVYLMLTGPTASPETNAAFMCNTGEMKQAIRDKQAKVEKYLAFSAGRGLVDGIPADPDTLHPEAGGEAGA